MNEPAGRASWKARFPDQLLVTTAGGEYLPLTIHWPEGQRPPARPVPGMLAGTGWFLYPNAEWHELHSGSWTAPVFPLPEQATGSDR